MQEGLYQNKLTVSLASIHNCKWPICQKKLLRNVKASRGAYHLTENVGNSGWKLNGKVTFRKFQPKIEEYVLR